MKKKPFDVSNSSRQPAEVLSRRKLLTSATAAGIVPLLIPGCAKNMAESKVHAKRRHKVAAIYTAFTHRSHVNVILENFLEPYYFNGQWVDPRLEFEIVSLWGDQFPKGDMAHKVSREYDIPIYDTIADALCLGGTELSVDAVLSIGEGGGNHYAVNDLQQVEYPRKRFFDEIVTVMRQSKRVVPLFTDKHLSYRWDWAKEMYDTARQMDIPLMAGSSISLGERRPPLEIPDGAEIAEAVSIHGGKLEVYDFHGLESLQAFVELRAGGETGVSQVQFVEGAQLWKAANNGRWSEELTEAAMATETGPDAKSWRELKPPPYAILLDYNDGFRAAMLRIGDDSIRWNFACRLKNQSAPKATRMFVGPWRNRYLFKAFSHAIQHFISYQKSPYPVERTFLTTGILEAAMRSRHDGGRPLATPHLNISYEPLDYRAFREMGATWKMIEDDVPEPRGIAKTTPRAP